MKYHYQFKRQQRNSYSSQSSIYSENNHKKTREQNGRTVPFWSEESPFDEHSYDHIEKMPSDEIDCGGEMNPMWHSESRCCTTSQNMLVKGFDSQVDEERMQSEIIRSNYNNDDIRDTPSDCNSDGESDMGDFRSCPSDESINDVSFLSHEFNKIVSFDEVKYMPTDEDDSLMGSRENISKNNALDDEEDYLLDTLLDDGDIPMMSKSIKTVQMIALKRTFSRSSSYDDDDLILDSLLSDKFIDKSTEEKDTKNRFVVALVKFLFQLQSRTQKLLMQESDQFLFRLRCLSSLRRYQILFEVLRQLLLANEIDRDNSSEPRYLDLDDEVKVSMDDELQVIVDSHEEIEAERSLDESSYPEMEDLINMDFLDPELKENIETACLATDLSRYDYIDAHHCSSSSSEDVNNHDDELSEELTNLIKIEEKIALELSAVTKESVPIEGQKDLYNKRIDDESILTDEADSDEMELERQHEKLIDDLLENCSTDSRSTPLNNIEQQQDALISMLMENCSSDDSTSNKYQKQKEKCTSCNNSESVPMVDGYQRSISALTTSSSEYDIEGEWELFEELMRNELENAEQSSVSSTELEATRKALHDTLTGTKPLVFDANHQTVKPALSPSAGSASVRNFQSEEQDSVWSYNVEATRKAIHDALLEMKPLQPQIQPIMPETLMIHQELQKTERDVVYNDFPTLFSSSTDSEAEAINHSDPKESSPLNPVTGTSDQAEAFHHYLKTIGKENSDPYPEYTILEVAEDLPSLQNMSLGEEKVDDFGPSENKGDTSVPLSGASKKQSSTVWERTLALLSGNTNFCNNATTMSPLPSPSARNESLFSLQKIGREKGGKIERPTIQNTVEGGVVRDTITKEKPVQIKEADNFGNTMNQSTLGIEKWPEPQGIHIEERVKLSSISFNNRGIQRSVSAITYESIQEIDADLKFDWDLPVISSKFSDEWELPRIVEESGVCRNDDTPVYHPSATLKITSPASGVGYEGKGNNRRKRNDQASPLESNPNIHYKNTQQQESNVKDDEIDMMLNFISPPGSMKGPYDEFPVDEALGKLPMLSWISSELNEEGSAKQDESILPDSEPDPKTETEGDNDKVNSNCSKEFEKDLPLEPSLDDDDDDKKKWDLPNIPSIANAHKTLLRTVRKDENTKSEARKPHWGCHINQLDIREIIRECFVSPNSDNQKRGTI